MSRAEQLAGYASSPQQFRNKIFNGDMRIAQRGVGPFTVGTKTFCTDRFASYSIGGPTAQVSQSSSAPADFLESLRYNIQFGATVDATDQSYIRYVIEGNDIRSLNWGIPDYAKNITISFWVRSSTAGLYGLSLSNRLDNLQYLATYEISVADTWEYKKITVAGPTSGSWSTDNTEGITIVWDLGIGSSKSGTETGNWTTGSGIIGVSTALNTTSTVKLAAAAGNFYLTGVQLEEGTVATPFEHRPYGTELALCQRYYNQFDTAEGAGGTRVYEVYGTIGGGDCNFCLATHSKMRATPLVTATGQTTANISGYSGLISEQGMINVVGTYNAAGRTYWYQETADSNGQRIIKVDAEL